MTTQALSWKETICKLSLSASALHSVAFFFSISVPLKEFVVDISHYAVPQQRTRSLSKLFIWAACFRAIERRLAPPNADGPREMTPAWTEHTGMCGLEEAASQSCQTAD